MPSVSEIRESIEARIVELRSEMTSLESARAALRKNGRGNGGSPAAKKRAEAAPAAAPAPGAAPAPDVTSEAPAKPVTRSPKARPRAKNGAGKSQKPTEVLLAGKLETMLREAQDGLALSAIATSANARESQVRGLLRDLESSGQVRRTGAGRGSRWRLASDEERIAERVAELEKLSAAKQ